MGLLMGAVVGLLLSCQVTKGDFVFGEPVQVPNVNSLSADLGPSISADGLELYFVSNRDHGADACYDDIWVAKRATIEDEWGEPVNLGAPINTAGPEADPSISADGLELYFSDGYPPAYRACAARPGGYGGGDLWVSTRATKDAYWGTPVNLGPEINSGSYDGTPAISADGLSLFFSSERSGGYGLIDLYVTTRPAKDDPWGPVVNLGAPVNTSIFEVCPQISPDGLSLFFTSDFSRGNIFVSKRATLAERWEPPKPLDSINTLDSEYFVTFSATGATLYFSRVDNFASWQSPLLATWDLWQVQVNPIVDFDGNSKVDIEDLIILIENWGQNEPSVDVAPAPFGDGVVNTADLEVLMSYWGRELDDPTLIAHWKLDEPEGNVAYDSAAQNDATVIGDEIWQLDGGKIDGALQFDGIDDHISTPFKLNPVETVFSVFAWVKGGAPGQVILSQEDGVNWLMADEAEGTLRTDISDPMQTSRRGTVGGHPLISSGFIADGNWHRIGFVWDGLTRILYVDDVVVAEDTLTNLVGASEGLRIGSGSNPEEGTFWSGMIDDVRIYDRVVVP